ncbi:uncharacterized protein ACRADG_004849 isoform 3-T3 [Cochliomyia hominivorax]
MFYLKYLIAILFVVIGVSSELHDIEDMKLLYSTQLENVKKSIDILKLRIEHLSEKDKLKEQESNRKLENLLEQRKKQTDRINDLEKNYSTLIELLNIIRKSEQRLIEKNTELEGKNLEFLKENENSTNSINVLTAAIESLKQKNSDLQVKYLELFKLYENVSNANDILKKRLYILAEHESDLLSNLEELKSFKQNEKEFDIRNDKIPRLMQTCVEETIPIDCAAATRCTKKSGYYKISIPGTGTKDTMVYCDTEFKGGNWLYIIRRHNGSENFSRPWLDYVNGFGDVELDYWLGLENLHALTNSNGQQELYIYIENFQGESRYAHYDNFVVGNASEFYELKSVGAYEGTAGNNMTYNVGFKFSTIDVDNDSWKSNSCAKRYEAGWWYDFCTHVLPTGKYLDADTEEVGVCWGGFGGIYVSNKIMNFMIRKVRN